MTRPLGRILYLLFVAVGVFFVPNLYALAALAGAHAVAWPVVGLPLQQLMRQLAKLGGFLIVLLVTYALVPMNPALDRWVPVDVWGMFSFDVNSAGLAVGGAMVLRVLTIVLASQVARAGNPQAIVSGLRQIGVPVTAAIAIDTVLALFGAKRGNRGKGDGSGGGGGKKKGRVKKQAKGFGDR
jgi:energy-coupling factor transporter transmembrane protein EcfT